MGFLVDVGIVWGLWLISLWKCFVEGGRGILLVFWVIEVCEELWKDIVRVCCVNGGFFCGVDLYLNELFIEWDIWGCVKGIELMLDDLFGEFVVLFFCKVLVFLRYFWFFCVLGRLIVLEFDDILKVICEFKGVLRFMSDCGENCDVIVEGWFGCGIKDCIGGWGGWDFVECRFGCDVE